MGTGTQVTKMEEPSCVIKTPRIKVGNLGNKGHISTSNMRSLGQRPLVQSAGFSRTRTLGDKPEISRDPQRAKVYYRTFNFEWQVVGPRLRPLLQLSLHTCLPLSLRPSSRNARTANSARHVAKRCSQIEILQMLSCLIVFDVHLCYVFHCVLKLRVDLSNCSLSPVGRDVKSANDGSTLNGLFFV